MNLLQLLKQVDFSFKQSKSQYFFKKWIFYGFNRDCLLRHALITQKSNPDHP